MSRKTKRLASVLLTACLAFSTALQVPAAADTVWAAENGRLQNGTLTANADGWTIGGDCTESENYGFTDGYLSIWNNDSTAKQFSISQTVQNVKAGSYRVKLAAVGNGDKGASTSNNSLTLTLKDETGTQTTSQQIITDGWDNWDNIVTTEKLDLAEGANVTITISGSLSEKDWYGIKNIVFDTDTTIQAPITVQKVDGLSEDFIHGIDVSSYLSLIQSGVKYYDANGQEQNMFAIFKDAGVNYVRLRVWNCPYKLDANGDYLYATEAGREYAADQVTAKQHADGYYEYFLADGSQVYRAGYGAGNCDIDTAIAIGKIATSYGMKVLIDFHYSDFWADPNKYTVPKAWQGMDIDQKKDALAAYTTDCMKKLKDAGVDVGMVQIGNEINNGMAGETDMANICTLLKAGSEAVRAADPKILIAIHYTDPQSEGYQMGKAKELADAGVDYDVFATSYYPFWHGTPQQLTANLKELADTYNKKVMVAEISYAWTTEDGDSYGNVVSEGASNIDLTYPVDIEGQATAIRDAIAAVAAVGEKGIGTFYWEPAWIPVRQYDADAANAQEAYDANTRAWHLYGSGWGSTFAKEYDKEVTEDRNGGTWDNQAYFDFSGKVLDSINVYKWVYTGAEGPKRVTTVDDLTYEMNYGTTPSLPDKVTVNFNDGTSQEVFVDWDAGQTATLPSADYGQYTIIGSVGEFSYETRGETVTVPMDTYRVYCEVTVTGHNYVTNGSFEDNDGDGSGWTLTNHLAGDKGAPKVDTSSSNAKTGLHYYTGWDNESMDFELSQEITDIPAGTYGLFAYYQGTSVSEVADTSTLYAIVTYKDGTSKTFSAPVKINNVWKDWYQAKVSDIPITNNVKSVKVGTRLACTGDGPWVVVDDISLMPTSTNTLAKVKGVKVKSTKAKTITVSYKAADGADGYQIAYSTNKNFKKKATNTAQSKKLTKKLTKLKSGKTYYVKVRAFTKNADGTKTYGAYSAVKKIKVTK